MLPPDLLSRLDAAIADGDLGLAEFNAAECRVLRSILPGRRPTRIALVGCGKEKLSTPAPARELYTGSLFAMARRFAETTCDRWFVLSAEHGLVAPETELAPYEAKLAGDSAWSFRVAAQLAKSVPADATLVLLAGEAYGAWRGLVPNPVEEPLKGMGIGARRAWLSRGNRRAA
jgi:hypothetical protein